MEWEQDWAWQGALPIRVLEGGGPLVIHEVASWAWLKELVLALMD